MKQSKLNLLLVMAIIVAPMAFHGSMAKEHIVGDGLGWTVPSSESYYHWWAAQQTFEPNDVLVFNFATGAHTVAQVSRAAYKICDASNPISLHTTSPARITIDPNQDQLYICSIGPHCKLFQKLEVFVPTVAKNSSLALPH